MITHLQEVIIKGKDGADFEFLCKSKAHTISKGKFIFVIFLEYFKSAGWISSKATDPRVDSLRKEREKKGMSQGYALLEAVKTVLGHQTYYDELAALPSRQKLARLQNQ